MLAPLLPRFPFACRIGAPLLFGRAKVVLARLVVPTAELLDVHAEVHRLCLPHLSPGPMANALPGQWTAHVTLARRVVPGQMGRGVADRGQAAGDHRASVVGLRRWDGNAKRRVSDQLIAAATLFGTHIRHAVDHQLANFLEVDRVQSDVNPVVSHVRLARQHELVGLGGHHRGPFLLGEADAHHRLVPRERDEDDAPHPELDLVAHHHLVGPRQ